MKLDILPPRHIPGPTFVVAVSEYYTPELYDNEEEAAARFIQLSNGMAAREIFPAQSILFIAFELRTIDAKLEEYSSLLDMPLIAAESDEQVKQPHFVLDCGGAMCFSEFVEPRDRDLPLYKRGWVPQVPERLVASWLLEHWDIDVPDEALFELTPKEIFKIARGIYRERMSEVDATGFGYTVYRSSDPSCRRRDA